MKFLLNGSILVSFILYLTLYFSLLFRLLTGQAWGVSLSMLLVSFFYFSSLYWIFNFLQDSPNSKPTAALLYFVVSLLLCPLLALEEEIQQLFIGSNQVVQQSQTAVTSDSHNQIGEAKAPNPTQPTKSPEEYEEALYFTVITFTTVGYGDYVPTHGWGQCFACFIGLLGTTHNVVFLALVLMALQERVEEAKKAEKSKEAEEAKVTPEAKSATNKT